MVSSFLRHVIKTFRVIKNKVYDGEIMPDHIIWSNGIGVSRIPDRFDLVGLCIKVVTGKGGNSSASFKKHYKMYQTMALSSFLHFPINYAFGDGAIEVPKIS